MRNAIIGIVIGIVLGVVVGATLLAPRLDALALANAGEAVEHLTPPPAPVAPEPEPAPDPASVTLRMASAYPGALPQIGTMARRIESEIMTVSDGRMQIRFFEPDTLVPVEEMFDAVASGAIDAAFSTPGIWGAKSPALPLFSSVPFGPGPAEYLAWIDFGGGRELFDKIYHGHNIHSLFCGIIGTEGSGWFRTQILTVDDLNGKRMRIFGLAADVMAKLGVEPVSLSPAGIFRAFEAGAIDAAEFSMPAIDQKLGFHEMAKHYYLPGWHQPATLFDLMINLETWQSLSTASRARIQSVCSDNIRYGLTEGEAGQFAALKALYGKGVEIHRWPRDILSAMRKAWTQVAAEHSQSNDEFRQVWSSLSAFREDYSVWRELSQM